MISRKLLFICVLVFTSQIAICDAFSQDSNDKIIISSISTSRTIPRPGVSIGSLFVLLPNGYNDVDINEICFVQFQLDDKTKVSLDYKFIELARLSDNDKKNTVTIIYAITLNSIPQGSKITTVFFIAEVKVHNKFKSNVISKARPVPVRLDIELCKLMSSNAAINIALNNLKLANSQLNSVFDFYQDYFVNSDIVMQVIKNRVYLVTARDGFINGAKELKRLIDMKWGGITDSPFYMKPLMSLYAVLKSHAEKTPQEKPNHETWRNILKESDNIMK